MRQKFIISIIILTCLGCLETDSNEYKLNEELIEKAQTLKQEMAEGNFPEVEANKLLPGASQQNSPKWILVQVFNAAKSGDFSMLKTLCDPIGKIDVKALRICNIANTSEKAKDDFVKYFELGKIASDEFINGDSAAVQITFGNRNTSAAMVNFVKRDSTWYMSSFD